MTCIGRSEATQGMGAFEVLFDCQLGFAAVPLEDLLGQTDTSAGLRAQGRRSCGVVRFVHNFAFLECPV